ncbi:MAG: winged helix-turn-helix transcriptional regulator [Alistipes sp.]|nr:winged helix-turn-helix transcriptional regulator [Candidatus Alistipes equi]
MWMLVRWIDYIERSSNSIAFTDKLPSNIYHIHFSRNPKIAQYLKAYKYVKEFGEGMDRICRELNANHTSTPKVHLDAFILKISINKSNIELIEKQPKNEEKLIEKASNIIEGLTENHQKLIEKFKANGDKLTESRLKILLLMLINPYISKKDLSKHVGISVNAISDKIEVMRDKYLNRVGPNKGGLWEVIVEKVIWSCYWNIL